MDSDVYVRWKLIVVLVKLGLATDKEYTDFTMWTEWP